LLLRKKRYIICPTIICLGRFLQVINSKFSTHLHLWETRHFVGLHLHNFVQVKKHQTEANQRKMNMVIYRNRIQISYRFLGVFVVLWYLSVSWRHAYFLLLDKMKDWLYITMIVNMARLHRKFQRQGWPLSV
ncbi:hypothetical protein CFP56_012037, partial [Quercus suber]